MKLKTKYSNLIVKSIMIYGLLVVTTLFIYKWVFVEKTDLLQIFGSLGMITLLIFIVFNSRKEIDFFELKNGEIRIRRFPFYILKKYDLNEVTGYYSSYKIYTTSESADPFDDSDDIKVKCYTIQFKNKSTIQITDLSFKELETVKNDFPSHGIKYLGKKKRNILIWDWIKKKTNGNKV